VLQKVSQTVQAILGLWGLWGQLLL
jgi:hypothetical protein